jgi:hypothetical protein
MRGPMFVGSGLWRSSPSGVTNDAVELRVYGKGYMELLRGGSPRSALMELPAVFYVQRSLQQ